MTVYIPILIAISSLVIFMLNGVPKINASINQERKVYQDAAEAVTTARSSENLLRTQAVRSYEDNSPYAQFNSSWGATANSLGQPEEISRLIVREAQQLGLRVANSRLQDAIELNTLESPIKSRLFNITIEGSHQQIGQWLVRCESIMRTLRIGSATWFPYGNDVQADVVFQLLDDDRLFNSGSSTLALPAWLQTQTPEVPQDGNVPKK